MSGFSGCVRSLQLNGRWLTSASHSFGVTPCYEGPSEPGTYFTEEGGYVLLGNIQYITTTLSQIHLIKCFSVEKEETVFPPWLTDPTGYVSMNVFTFLIYSSATLMEQSFIISANNLLIKKKEGIKLLLKAVMSCGLSVSYVK